MRDLRDTSHLFSRALLANHLGAETVLLRGLLVLTFAFGCLRMTFRCAIHGSSSLCLMSFLEGSLLGSVAAILGPGLETHPSCMVYTYSMHQA